MSTKFYITTSVPYVNSTAHLGHVLEFVQADVIARHHKLLGDDVFFLTGTDEHGAKIIRAAEEANKDPQQFVNELAEHFRLLLEKLDVSNDDFIRTTDQNRHWPAVYDIWKKLEAKGDLYKAKYEGLYCVGHEAFMKKSELVNGECPDHKTKPEIIEEENYFFKLSKYKDELKKIIEAGELKILPEHKTNEVLRMLEELEDISVSRPRKDLKWGIPVQSDAAHTVYVWVDALINYLSGIGYPSDSYKKWWPVDCHLIGKDILKFHAIIWPAMLLSIGLELPKSIYVHGFITAEGEKMSKTVGNVIDPFELIKKYGVDAVRYYFLREIPSYEDGDFSENKFKERYNSDLANNLGNLVSRTLTVIKNRFTGDFIYKSEFLDDNIKSKTSGVQADYKKNIEEFKLHEALSSVFKLIDFANTFIDDRKPWKESPEDLLKTANNLVYLLLNISRLLQPFIPQSADKIFKQLGIDKDIQDIESQHFEIKKGEALFPRV